MHHVEAVTRAHGQHLPLHRGPGLQAHQLVIDPMLHSLKSNRKVQIDQVTTVTVCRHAILLIWYGDHPILRTWRLGYKVQAWSIYFREDEARSWTKVIEVKQTRNKQDSRGNNYLELDFLCD